MTAKQVYALCKNYTDISVAGAGAIKGKNCEIQSIEPITGGNRVTFAWYNGSDVLVTDTLDVMDGEKGDKGDTGDTGATGATGNGISTIEKTSTVGNVDTYTITMTDGTTATFTVTNGGVNVVANPEGTASDSLTKIEIGETIYSISGGSGGASSYTELEDKPTVNNVTFVGDMTGADLGLVDAVSGKGLSTNDFTDAYKDAIDGLGTASTKDVPASGDAASTEVVLGSDTRLTDSRNAKDVYSWAKAENKPSYTASEVGAIPSTDKGSNSGVATLDANGKVPTSQLPSYVDDVIEGYYKVADGKFYEESTYETEITPESGKIYSDLSTNKTYRWGGSAYVQLDAGLALGETVGTAYEGNKGKANADAITAIKDGSTIDSFGDVETALAGKISTSQTAGLVKNDGSIDTTTTAAVSANTTAISAIKDGQSIDSFSDVETALARKMPDYSINHGLMVWYDAQTGTESLQVDYTSSVTQSSEKPITSGGVYTALGNKQDTISDLSTIRSGASAGATAYQKPQTGIPSTDLASGVIPDVTGKADKVSNPTNGNFAGLDSNGNLTDSGKSSSDFLPSNTPIPSVSVSHTGTASSTTVRKQIITVDNVSYDVDGSAYLENNNVTLSTSQATTVTFTNAIITDGKTLTLETSLWDLVPDDMVTTEGVCTVTLPKWSSAVTIGVRLRVR